MNIFAALLALFVLKPMRRRLATRDDASLAVTRPAAAGPVNIARATP